MSDPVDTDVLRMNAVEATRRGGDWGIVGQQLDDAADEIDRLRGVDEFGMGSLVKAAADEWFDQHAPSNVSMDDLNLLVHMITEKLRGTRD